MSGNTGLMPKGMVWDPIMNSMVPDPMASISNLTAYQAVTPSYELNQSGAMVNPSATTPSVAPESSWMDSISTPGTSVKDAAGNITKTPGSTFGLSNDLWGGMGTAAQLGLGFLNYKDAHAMNKKNMAGMDQNLKNAKAEADATAKYRAAYGA